VLRNSRSEPTSCPVSSSCPRRSCPMRARTMRDTRFSQLLLTPGTVGCRRRERPGHRAAPASVAPCEHRPERASRVRRVFVSMTRGARNRRLPTDDGRVVGDLLLERVGAGDDRVFGTHSRARDRDSPAVGLGERRGLLPSRLDVVASGWCSWRVVDAWANVRVFHADLALEPVRVAEEDPQDGSEGHCCISAARRRQGRRETRDRRICPARNTPRWCVCLLEGPHFEPATRPICVQRNSAPSDRAGDRGGGPARRPPKPGYGAPGRRRDQTLTM